MDDSLPPQKSVQPTVSLNLLRVGRGPLSSEYGTYKTVKCLGFQVKVLESFQVVPSSLGRGGVGGGSRRMGGALRSGTGVPRS